MTLYKWLNGREATHVRGFRYRLKAWTQPIEGPLVACENGYHLNREQDLVRWIARDLFVAEHDGELLEVDDKVVVRRCRIVEHLTGWNETTARLFAADCAERVLPLFEARCPDDDRPRRAIEATRLFARGEIDAAGLASARAAALGAGLASAVVAARDAAWDAAREAARGAAGAAAREAARAATWGAAREAAREAEREWQTAQLLRYARKELT